MIGLLVSTVICCGLAIAILTSKDATAFSQLLVSACAVILLTTLIIATTEMIAYVKFKLWLREDRREIESSGSIWNGTRIVPDTELIQSMFIGSFVIFTARLRTRHYFMNPRPMIPALTYSLITFIAGWWSIVGLVFTPLAIFKNLTFAYRIKARDLLSEIEAEERKQAATLNASSTSPRRLLHANTHMHSIHRLLTLLLACSATVWSFALPTHAADAPITLKADARDVSRHILHATLHIPAKPGPLTLVYPKWIPGEHGPTGPIADLVGLKLTAGGKPVSWRRDPEDNYALLIEVPAGAQAVDVALDFLLASDPNGFSSAASSSANLAAISWNTLLLYPKGAAANSVSYAAHLQLPDGWKFATALPREGGSAREIQFAPVTLETLIDSPVVAGKYVRTIELSPGSAAPERLNVIADSAAALDISTNDQAFFARLPAEARALFGAHHYQHYDFLLTLSDEVAHFGLEHHESSDDRGPERMLIDADIRKQWANLLPHEMVHSWNGKYRRPAGLATPDYQQPMKTELLWVYEGLTEYLGNVLAARSGLWTSTNYFERLALEAAMLDHRRGRDWRPLVDTTDAAHLLYNARGEGASWRRSVDFYPEGNLIWMEADVTLRHVTNGKHSLDDFCRSFFGGENTGPRVVPYSLDDVIAALNAVAPFDWRGFFQQRVYTVNPRAPLGGIEGGGWRLVYRDEESDMLKADEEDSKSTDLTCSIGISIKEDGGITDVIPGSACERAGIGPGMKLLAVNNRRWKPELLRTAIKEAKENRAPIELLVENGDVFKSCAVNYHEGERYPHLERDRSKPDLLSEIIKARSDNRSGR